MFDINNFLSTKPIKLVRGQGSPTIGGCWMSALSAYAGEKWSDHPDCVCPIINPICVVINDGLSDNIRAYIIGPRLLDPAGTKSTPEVERERTKIIFSAILQDLLPFKLELASNEFLPNDSIINSFPCPLSIHASFRERIMSHIKTAVSAYFINSASSNILCAYRCSLAISLFLRLFGNDFNMVDKYCITKLMPVLDRMLAVGNKTPIEMKCQPENIKAALGVKD